MNHLAKYLTMKIIPREYENDLDQIELAVYGMEGLLCNLSTLFVAIILSFIFHTTYEFVLFIFFFSGRHSAASATCRGFFSYPAPSDDKGSGLGRVPQTAQA